MHARLAAIGFAISLWGLSAAHAAPAAKVQTDAGWVQGQASADNSLYVFKGLPFAKPPVGELRWRAPEKPAPWGGVRKADAFAPSCMQPTPPRGETAPPSEDCLYLNIWEPAKAAGRLPVMVWIYGGGFRTGAGSMPVFDGSALARKGVILVTINYRLGKFGFMAHPQLTAESGHGASGNYGLMDQLAALQWVQRNIAAFGGDPRAVTVFGQSAGSHSLNYLIASPLGKGLFSRAIAESGSAFTPDHTNVFGHPLLTLKQAEQNGLKVQAALHAGSIADMRKASAKDLQTAPTAGGDDSAWGMLDGWVLPDTVNNIFARGAQNDVALLIGFNSNEAATFAHDKTQGALTQTLARNFGARASDWARIYPSGDDLTAEKASEQSERDNHFGWQSWTWLKRQAATGKSKAWYYFFDVQAPPGNGAAVSNDWGAHHEGEIPYVFGTGVNWSERDRRVSDRMQDYWTNFAKTGDPNGPGLPAWASFDAARPVQMVFDDAPTARPLAGQDRLAFWEAQSKQ